VAASVPEPISSVTFRIPERASRVAQWIDDAFMTNCSEGLSLHSDELAAGAGQSSTLYTQNGFHTERLTHRTVYTQNGLHTERFTHRTV
jgi:hypothetical protein